MDPDVIVFILGVILFVGMLVLAFTTDSLVERSHYRDIRRREEEMRDILLIPVRTTPPSMRECRQVFVTGSVVIGMDHFKRTLAGLRGVVGGRIGAYESLFERARREAILRMKEEARAHNAKCILNIKFSTANIMSGTKENKGSGCVEVIAYGTALAPSRGR
jgi:uncharacterized protein YbjQ (UPF0145 family)